MARTKDAPLSIGLSGAEREKLEKDAAKSGKTVSEFARLRLFAGDAEGERFAEMFSRIEALESRLSTRVSETVEAHGDALGERQRKLIDAEFSSLKSGLQTGLTRLAEMIQKGGR